MKKIILFIPLVLLISCLLTSCLRLDSNLFHNTKLNAYLLDANPQPQEIALDASYNIAGTLIHQVPLASDDNGSKATIYGIYLGDISRIATDTVIMYFHGTKDNMDYYWNREKLLANVGWKHRFGVFMIDYRGYGMSEGKPTESGMHADANAAIAWLKSNGLTSNRLIVYGFSLGTAAATYYTANPQTLVPAKLILEAPFGSAAVMTNDATVLALPSSYFTNLKVDNAEEIKKVQQPFMWIHGINDDFLSIKTHGELVFANYKGVYSEAHRTSGATHVNVPSVWGLENYKTALNDFITK
jgi:pimeloyl-ACP methyl ester carboxylesterase